MRASASHDDDRLGLSPSGARGRGRYVLVALLAALSLLPAALALGAGKKPETQKVAAHFVYVSNTINGGCLWGIGIEFSSAPGASSYVVKYWDGYYQQLITTTATPAQLSTDPSVPKGTLLLGVTGGSYSSPCSDSGGDATENGRFSKGATAYAVFPRGTHAIEGTVKAACGSTCTSPPVGVSGVAIEVRGPKFHGSVTTGDGGTFAIRVPDGHYTLEPVDRSFHFTPRKRVLSVSADVSRKDFDACMAGKTAAIASAAAFKRPGGLYVGKSCENQIAVKYTASRHTLRIVWVALVKCGNTASAMQVIAPTDVQPIGPGGEHFNDTPDGSLVFAYPLNDAEGDSVAGTLNADGRTGHASGTYNNGGCHAATSNGGVKLELKG